MDDSKWPVYLTYNQCHGHWWPDSADDKRYMWLHLFTFPCSMQFGMPLPLDARGIMFLGCPSVCPKPEIPSFQQYMGPSDQPWPFCGMSAHPSLRPYSHHNTFVFFLQDVRLEMFPGICRRTHGGNCMLMYLGYLQNWLDYGHGLFIFLLLAPLWLRDFSNFGVLDILVLLCGFS